MCIVAARDRQRTDLSFREFNPLSLKCLLSAIYVRNIKFDILAGTPSIANSSNVKSMRTPRQSVLGPITWRRRHHNINAAHAIQVLKSEMGYGCN